MGLVILSVFAVAFAACGNSGSGDNTTPGPTQGTTAPTNGNGPTNPTPTEPPAPSVVGLTILSNPGNPTGFELDPYPAINFEAQRPILTGLILEVRYSDNSRKVVSGNSANFWSEGFYTDPYFCPDPYLAGTGYANSSGDFYNGIRPYFPNSSVGYMQWNPGQSGYPSGLPTSSGAATPNTNPLAPIQFSLYHGSAPGIRVNFRIAFIRPIFSVSWSGSPSKVNYFEDDVEIDPSGIIATVTYAGDLRYDGMNTDPVTAASLPGWANTGIPSTSLNDTNGKLPLVTTPIAMTRENLIYDWEIGGVGSGSVTTPGVGINIDNSANPYIRVRLGNAYDGSLRKVDPRTNNLAGNATYNSHYFRNANVSIYTIRAIQAEYDASKLDDHFQYDTKPWVTTYGSLSEMPTVLPGRTNAQVAALGDDGLNIIREWYWTDQLFNKAGLTLKVLYAGTEETKTIDYVGFKRAESMGLAKFVAAPDLCAQDIEAVSARIGYYTTRNVNNDQDPSFPNQALNVLIPVLEFENEIQFVRKPLMPDVPLYIEGLPNSASALTNLSASNARAIAMTYDLMAVYSGDKYKSINSLLGNGVFTITAAGDYEYTMVDPTFWGQYNFRNETQENIERELRYTLRLANSTITKDGVTDYNGFVFTNGTSQSASDRTFRAFNNRRADLEPAVEILPYKGY